VVLAWAFVGVGIRDCMERFVLGIISLEHLSKSLCLPVSALAYIFVDRENTPFDSDAIGYSPEIYFSGRPSQVTCMMMLHGDLNMNQDFAVPSLDQPRSIWKPEIRIKLWLTLPVGRRYM
jgi:hypothetical protein